MKDTCTGEDVFLDMDTALKSANLDYERLVGIATDGAPAIAGTQTYFRLPGHLMAEQTRAGCCAT